MTGIVLCAAANSEQILAANLARSPLIGAGVPLHVEWHAPSAAIAYNRALDATGAEIVVFVHQDVFLPPGWDAVLAARLAELSARDPDWALFGSFGVALDGRPIGPVWSSSLGMIVGRVPLAPEPVQSYDELLIVMRRSAGLRFDENLPGWHLYGTDIVQTARARGRVAYAGALPCIHNDRYHDTLGADFTECYRAMQRKWAGALPVRTPVTKISRSGLSLWRGRWRDWRYSGVRHDMALGTGAAPELLAARCGWADLSASV